MARGWCVHLYGDVVSLFLALVPGLRARSYPRATQYYSSFRCVLIRYLPPGLLPFHLWS